MKEWEEEAHRILNLPSLGSYGLHNNSNGAELERFGIKEIIDLARFAYAKGLERAASIERKHRFRDREKEV